MPAALDKCVSEIMGKGHDESSSMAICRTSMGMAQNKDDIDEITKKAFEISEDVKSGKVKIDEKNYSDINDVEIFAAGTWNGDNYTDRDLDNIVSSFKKTKEYLKPYLKLGHSEKQKLLSSDELPAAGFIDNVRKVGKKLVADFINVPKKIFDLIKNKAYTRVSSELFVNMNVNGERHPLALKAVALLGGETPAVHTLNDIVNLYASGVTTVAYDNNTETKTYDIEVKDFSDSEKTTYKEDSSMELKELQDKNEALEKAISEAHEEVKKHSEEAAQLKKKVEELENEKAEKEAKYAEEKLNSDIEAMVKDGKIVPAQKELAYAILKNMQSVKEFTIGEKTYKDNVELVKAFIDANVILNTTENSKTGDKPELKGDDKLISEAKKYMEENKVTFKEALLKVSKGNG